MFVQNLAFLMLLEAVSCLETCHVIFCDSFLLRFRIPVPLKAKSYVSYDSGSATLIIEEEKNYPAASHPSEIVVQNSI
jgi:hypothetical protein